MLKVYRAEKSDDSDAVILRAEVKEGDTIVDFRGKPWTFISVTRGSKIYAKDQERSGWWQEFFPSVFKLTIVEEKDDK